MDLEILKHYLSFLTQTQYDLCRNRRALELDQHNSFNFYKLLAPKSQPAVDSQMMKTFISSFTYNFQTTELEALIKNTKFQLMPEDQRYSRQELMAKGIELFMRRYSRQGSLTFEEFSLFLKEQEQLPERPKELGFPLKRQFFELLETQIQNLLDAETFKRAVGLHYRNLDDLFELVSCDGIVDLKQISNLFLGLGQRKDQLFLQMLSLRFPLPMDETTFKKWFEVPTAQNNYKKQTKIYYSSLKRNKLQFSKEDDRFMTPGPKTAGLRAGMTSTKMTKGERLNSIKRSAVEVSRFISEECPEQSTGAILADILTEEERVNEMKKQLLYQPDYDLQLFYSERGRQFQNILNKKYGSCNFTSFVRYLVPQDYEHRYYAFIKYNKQNKLTQETNNILSQVLQEEEAKEERIAQWWRPHDREMIFRSYCAPGHKGITPKELSKYFTERQSKILLDRFDPHKTGLVNLDSFV